MVAKLSKEAREYYEDLEKNFSSHVESSRKQKMKELSEGKRKELLAELQKLEKLL